MYGRAEDVIGACGETWTAQFTLPCDQGFGRAENKVASIRWNDRLPDYKNDQSDAGAQP